MCNACGQLQGIPEYDEKLWDIYHRLPELVSRSYIEPFVYTQDDLDELGFYDDEDSREVVMMSMERNMIERGLCGGCGRPNLQGRDMSELMSEEEAQDLHDMYAEQAAERRMGA
jgi:hypothetical protein